MPGSYKIFTKVPLKSWYINVKRFQKLIGLYDDNFCELEHTKIYIAISLGSRPQKLYASYQIANTSQLFFFRILTELKPVAKVKAPATHTCYYDLAYHTTNDVYGKITRFQLAENRCILV